MSPRIFRSSIRTLLEKLNSRRLNHKQRCKVARELLIWAFRLKRIYKIEKGQSRFYAFKQYLKKTHAPVLLIDFDKYRYRPRSEVIVDITDVLKLMRL